MTAEKITAKLKDQDDSEAVTCQYDFGDNLKDAVAKFGEDVVFNRFKSAAVIDAQSLIRRGIKAGKSPTDIQKDLTEWRPGMKRVQKKSAEERIKEQFSKLTPEERAELVKQLKAG